MDRYAAERALQFKLGWFANPIFGNGDYPAVMKQVVAKKSATEGRNVSRLPAFTDEEIRMNKGTRMGNTFLSRRRSSVSKQLLKSFFLARLYMVLFVSIEKPDLYHVWT